MSQSTEYWANNEYVRIATFDLNSRESTPLGEPSQLPADSFLISRYSGNTSFHILIDAGKKDQAKMRIIPQLLQMGIGKLDMAVVSHPHQDHFGGFIDILNYSGIEVGQLIYAPVDENDIERGDLDPLNYETWREFTEVLRQSGIACRKIMRDETGGTIRIDSDLYLDIIDVPLFRQDSSERVNINNLNLVLKLQYKEFTALFPGDCAVKQSGEIMASAAGDRITDLFMLKAAHHGGTQSLTPEFIASCNARIVIIPSNYYIVEQAAVFADNIREYGKNGAKLLRTDLYRTIELQTDGYSVRCSAESPDETDYSFFP
ncbi:ComEC/Rec2 family competence protein [Paenibacillus thalictri]|uniref:MBL fold metallo-hydrolase n=1 Tax=Paenibacillus thalictri TaxID=2527873 RepID=A0A4Q9DTD3_9BACL|nr:MBL fold metallo-hydrolase [Paenibacillus thalictri]TBL78950.1 MBL fold metallo-hydrolase [Paenibacillus thalictri]